MPFTGLPAQEINGIFIKIAFDLLLSMTAVNNVLRGIYFTFATADVALTKTSIMFPFSINCKLIICYGFIMALAIIYDKLVFRFLVTKLNLSCNNYQKYTVS